MLTKLVSNYRPSQVSKYSRRSLAPSSKTYISKLEKQLESEKQARLQLEKEVEEMKKINAEISSKLGLSNASAAKWRDTLFTQMNNNLTF